MNIKYDIMTAHNAHEVLEFYHKAVNEPEIRRFMTGSTFYSLDSPKETSWQHVTIMSKDRTGLVILRPDNQVGLTVNMECFVLPSMRQALIAGRLLKVAISHSIMHLGGRWLEWATHATNDKCIKISEHLGAKQWGHKYESFWDCAIGMQVASCHYRLDLKKSFDFNP